MLEFSGKLGEQLKQLFGGWPTFIAVGTFFLYLTGYLATRFYLTVLGVGADLSVIDEQYLFAGAKFVIYLFSTVPILLMPILILAAVGWGVKRLFRAGNKVQPPEETPARKKFYERSSVVPIVGIVFSLIMIQVVMRKCFLLNNVLVAEKLPEAGLGLERLLLDEDNFRTNLYFMGLVAGTLVTTAIWLLARRIAPTTWVGRTAVTTLTFLVLIQFLFLPINYGIFVQGRFLPRVVDLGDQHPLPQGYNAWLVWEGTHTFTYLVEEPRSPQVQPSPSPTPTSNSAVEPTPSAMSLQTVPAPFGRKLISVPQKDLKQITIVKYDPIMRYIFVR